MKKIDIKSLFFFLSLLTICSCSSEKNNKDVTPFVTLETAEKQFVSSLTKQDTLVVSEMSDRWMNMIKSNHIDLALDSIYEMINYELNPLTTNRRKQLKDHFNNFPVINYKKIHFAFSTQGHNDIQYRINFSEEDPNATITFMFNPVKIEGKWYLAIKEGNRYSKTQRIQRHKLSPAPLQITFPKK